MKPVADDDFEFEEAGFIEVKTVAPIPKELPKEKKKIVKRVSLKQQDI